MCIAYRDMQAEKEGTAYLLEWCQVLSLLEINLLLSQSFIELINSKITLTNMVYRFLLMCKKLCVVVLDVVLLAELGGNLSLLKRKLTILVITIDS